MTSTRRPRRINFAWVSVRVLRRLSACALPRPSAIASAKFANSTVNHSHSAIWNSNPASAILLRHRVAKQREHHQHAGDFDHEHHRISNHPAPPGSSLVNDSIAARETIFAIPKCGSLAIAHGVKYQSLEQFSRPSSAVARRSVGECVGARRMSARRRSRLRQSAGSRTGCRRSGTIPALAAVDFLAATEPGDRERRNRHHEPCRAASRSAIVTL